MRQLARQMCDKHAVPLNRQRLTKHHLVELEIILVTRIFRFYEDIGASFVLIDALVFGAFLSLSHITMTRQTKIRICF